MKNLAEKFEHEAEEIKYERNFKVLKELTKTAKNNYGILMKISLIIKRFVDIIGAIVGIILLIPLTIVVGIGNFICKEKGNLFYTQERIGKDGQLFKMYKFRTMVTNSQEILDKLLAENEEIKKEWEDNRKLRNDPRITKMGKFLRKTSLDEFPQFINVLIGNMSLVGPRAVVGDEIEKFGEFKEKVLSVKPGITGYWAANGRSDTTYEERVMLESLYVDKFSLLLDIKLLFKTVWAVFRKEGAI